MPMPQTTPPISWLCDALGLMIFPHAVTSIARVTRTVPRSGSTFTSTNCAPCASVAYLSRSLEGRASLLFPPRKQTRADGETRPVIRRADARRRPGAPLRRGARELCVAELELHLLGPEPQVLGGDHGDDRVGPGADVARRAGNVCRAVHLERDSGGGGHLESAPDAGGRPPADQ